MCTKRHHNHYLHSDNPIANEVLKILVVQKEKTSRSSKDQTTTNGDILKKKYDIGALKYLKSRRRSIYTYAKTSQKPWKARGH